ncbi:8451_t:CDS:2 [Dentiscutata erythropus]|uniref:8451_t:CDS:1 n=1 Tax=Dentiscutata erythropus TaxID=1348616 RepID=A0A9N9P5N6_9GLOM|nr:8451_t:CDS:2 [Dentiscutata erythropus]
MPKVERDTGNKNRITPYHSTPRHIEQVVLSGAKKSTLSPPKDHLISNPFDEPLMPLTRKEIMDLLRSEELLDSAVQNDSISRGSEYTPFMWQVDYFLTLLEKYEGKAKQSSRNLMFNHLNHVNGNKSEMSKTNLWPPGMPKHKEGR